MDLSKKTDKEIQDLLASAIERKDTLVAGIYNAELQRRANAQVIGETNVPDQAISGLYKGISKLGAPVDLAASGLEKLGLRDSENPPVGGSQSIQNLIQTLSGGEGITNVPPQNAAQRIAANTGEVLGETGAATAGLLATVPSKVSTASSSAYQAFKNVLARVRGEAKEAPAKFAGVEAGAAIGGGMAEGGSKEVFGENPTANMIANILGSLSGGKSMSFIDDLMRKGYKGPLSANALKLEAGNLYEWQIENGLSAQPNITEEIYDRAFSIVDRNGVVEPVPNSNKTRVSPEYPKVKGQLRILQAYADKGMTGANIMSVRKGIMNRINDAEGTERNILRNILREFDEVTGQLTDNIRVANGMYAKAMKAEQIDELMELAKISASNANNNMENAIRTEFRQLLRRIVKGSETGWSQKEIEAINKVVEGGPIENSLRTLGKFAPSNSLTALLPMYAGGGAYMAVNQITGDPALSYLAAGGVAGAGAGARMAGAQVQKGNVDKILQTIMQGRNLSPDAADKLYSALTAYYSGQALSQGMNQ
jgi:hypothetical protein